MNYLTNHKKQNPQGANQGGLSGSSRRGWYRTPPLVLARDCSPTIDAAQPIRHFRDTATALSTSTEGTLPISRPLRKCLSTPRYAAWTVELSTLTCQITSDRSVSLNWHICHPSACAGLVGCPILRLRHCLHALYENQPHTPTIGVKNR